MSASGAMSEHEYRENKFFSIFGSVPEPPFESAHEQTAVWGRRWGCNSDVGRLRVVLMHRPGEELSVVKNQPMPEIGGFGDPEKGWYWMGRTLPDLPAMQRAHDEFTRLLRSEGVEVVLVGEAAPGAMKQIFTRDSVIGVPGGAIVTRLARRVRRGEELPVTRALATAGCPILATIHGSAVFEGGGFAFLDAKTAVCSESVACNGEGVRQIEAVLSRVGVTLIKVPMPGYRIHIDGSFMMVDVRYRDRQRQRTAIPIHRVSQATRHALDRVAAGRQSDVAELPGDRAGTGGDARWSLRATCRPAGCGRYHGADLQLRTGGARGRRHPLLHRSSGARSGLIWRFWSSTGSPRRTAVSAR